MKVLALDTATSQCSVALWQDGQRREHSLDAGQKHSELLVPMVDALLAEAGIGLLDLDGIAYGAGPGAFTSLRIACGVVQGLALAADLPVVGISTLLALAEASEAERVIAALDARMNEIYLAAYERCSTGWTEVLAAGVHAPDASPAVAGSGWTGVGTGFAVADGVLVRQYGGQLAAVWPERQPQAGAMAALAAPMLAAGLGQDASLAAPLYVRDRVALTTAERERLRATRDAAG